MEKPRLKNSDEIFLLGADQSLQKMPSVEYDSEDLLQSLIESYPELIVGEQIDPDDPPRWFVVAREAGIPDAEESGSRWAVDHLLLDQSGKPTFVEVKRSTDTRIRREVVGQMLDYAANAVVYWPVDRVRQLATEQYSGSNALDQFLTEFLDAEVEDAQESIESYWEQVERQLRSGDVRLLFVADLIPRELRRIIEYLNEKMATVEVLGVEIKQYTGEQFTALVPRVIGQTETARDAKSRSGTNKKPPLTEADLYGQLGTEEEVAIRSLLQESEDKGWDVVWHATQIGIQHNLGGKSSQAVAYLNVTKGHVEIWAYLQYLSGANPMVCEMTRADIEKLGDFSTNWTFKLNVEEGNLPRIKDLMKIVWLVPERMSAQKSEGKK